MSAVTSNTVTAESDAMPLDSRRAVRLALSRMGMQSGALATGFVTRCIRSFSLVWAM
jgi:hypothetical protein